MTYMHNGRQFVVMGVRGTANSGAQLVAFALPQPQPPGGRGGRGGRRSRRRSGIETTRARRADEELGGRRPSRTPADR